MTPYVELHLAELESMLGESEAARERVRVAAVELREYDQLPGLPTIWTRTAAAAVELNAGNLEAADAVLAPACVELRETEHGAWFASHATTLADIRLSAGAVDDALALVEEAAATAPADDRLPQAGWRQVWARALAQARDMVKAERLAREAVALLEPTDAPNSKAEAQLTLAHVLELGAHGDEARELRLKALGLFEKKGNLVGVERALQSIPSD